jgi:K+-transporting ATPase ATPase C chain
MTHANFSARPSAVNYMQGSASGAPAAGGATNISSASARLEAQVAERAAAFRALNGLPDTVAVPAEMLFASGSGLDPHISPRAALLQAERVAAARGFDPAAVIALVEAHVEQPLLGFLGQPRVNVLQLNLALNQLQ